MPIALNIARYAELSAWYESMRVPSQSKSTPSTGRFCLLAMDIQSSRNIPRTGLMEARSEEHTSELQSLRHLVCRLLLEKKKRRKRTTTPAAGESGSRV